MAPVKIAVLDDYQELSKPHFEELKSSGYDVVTFTDTLLPYNHPDTPKEAQDALVQRLESFTIICSMRERTPFPTALVERLPNLKLLLTTGGRNASIDVQACRARGITVAGTAGGISPHGSSGGLPDSTTQHCVALILALARGLARDDAAVKAGGWQTGCATGLAGRTFGAVGLGRLGAAVARILHLAFGMRVVAWSANLTQDTADAQARAAGLPVSYLNPATGQEEKTFRAVSREALFSEADVVSVHLVLSDRTRGLVGAADLARLKPSALFVNTARGPIVDEAALLAAAQAGALRGIALDVFHVEPLPPGSPWRSARWGQEGTAQVLLSPHMGYVEAEPLGRWYRQQVENIRRWEKGEALATVFKDNGY